MSTTIKPTLSNIISLWFGVDTPLRQYRIQHNPALWSACLRTNQTFKPASKIRQTGPCRPSDKAAFARAVQQELSRGQSLGDKRTLRLA